jgi:hypothetical protein
VTPGNKVLPHRTAPASEIVKLSFLITHLCRGLNSHTYVKVKLLLIGVEKDTLLNTTPGVVFGTQGGYSRVSRGLSALPGCNTWPNAVEFPIRLFQQTDAL